MSSPEDHANDGARTAALANHVVRVTNEYTGRGPTRARAHVEGDLVSVLLADTLTKGERSLVRDGRGELVLETRRAYQATMREELIAGVEEIVGRRVIAFMSDNHLDPDMAVEVFVLEPRSAD